MLNFSAQKSHSGHRSILRLFFGDFEQGKKGNHFTNDVMIRRADSLYRAIGLGVFELNTFFNFNEWLTTTLIPILQQQSTLM